MHNVLKSVKMFSDTFFTGKLTKHTPFQPGICLLMCVPEIHFIVSQLYLLH